MASSRSPANYKNYNGVPQSMYTSRTRSALPSSAPKSNSAMSSRTYSRVKGGTPKKSGGDVRRSMNFDGNDSSQFEDSMVDMAELQNEQELLKRMIDQQRQLQELRERQKRVLELQQQLANMEATAELSMEEKLEKLKTAKTRLDELQNLVTTIKSEESSKAAAGDSPKVVSNKALQVRKALEELHQLKNIIGMVSEDLPNSAAGEQSVRKPAATMEPVFPHSVEADEREAGGNYQPVLPEVSVVQYDDLEDEDQRYSRPSPRKSPKRRSMDSGRAGRRVHSSQARSPYKNRGSSSKKKTVRTKSPEKESVDPEASEKLFEEMRRHQILLRELRDRRKELEDLMNMTKATEGGEEGEEEGDEYNDTNASIRSNLGSSDESRGVSDTEQNQFDTSQSGQLFGLNETDTRRLLDLIRNQKELGPATEKTTATWGSSSSDSSDDEQEENDEQTPGKLIPREVAVDGNLPGIGTTVRDAFTQLNRMEEHEIDFRPPTRRRRNITQSASDNKRVSMDVSTCRASVDKIEDNLSASNNTMHILLEDQQALTRLLLNTLNLQQNNRTSNLCYGISPDFLIYQLDNCSAQFAAILKEMKDLQWQLYSLTKTGGESDRPAPAASTRTPLATLGYISQQQPEPTYHNQLQPPKPSSSVDQASMALQPSEGEEKYALVQKEETGDEERDLFEALRDSIYSEAAILISQNEARPHFLIELFHTLQQLNTDYLRQHALYALQDVMKGYIPISPRKNRKQNSSAAKPQKSTKIPNRGSFSENTPSESAATSEDEVYAKLRSKVPETSGYDFSLKVSSASDLSTPSDDENNPFAAEDLGSTVIHLDAALRHMREVERLKQEMQNASSSAQSSDKSGKKTERIEVAQVNTKVLRVWIKNIVSEIIPILKSNHDKMVDKKLVKVLQGKVLECVAKGMTDAQQANSVLAGGDANDATDDSDKLNIENFFSGQLKSILNESFNKFVGRRVGACGEDLIVGLSEILFNELAFFYMMQDLGRENKSGPKAKDVPTIKIEHSEGGNAQQADENEEEQEEDGDSELSTAEDNIPGSNRENTNHDQNFEKSGETSPHPVTVDLSVSETKPLTSYGSGEDEEEEGSGDEYDYREQDVATSMQQDADDDKNETVDEAVNQENKAAEEESEPKKEDEQVEKEQRDEDQTEEVEE